MYHRIAGIVFALALVGLLTVGRAQGERSQQGEVFPIAYLPLITRIDPPPPLGALIIQQRDMPSGYTIDDLREIPNEEAAQRYSDPAAALAAFEAQGRESSYFVAYSSDDYYFTNAIGVSDQVVRFATPEGADVGMDYVIANVRQRNPEYGIIFALPLGDRMVALRRTFTENNLNLVHYYYGIRKGRSITLVQAIGLSSALSGGEAYDYAEKAAARLP